MRHLIEKIEVFVESAARASEEDSDLTKAIIAWLKENPNPIDKDLHDWAEGEGYDVHEVESQIYRLATKYIASMKEKP